MRSEVYDSLECPAAAIYSAFFTQTQITEKENLKTIMNYVYPIDTADAHKGIVRPGM